MKNMTIAVAQIKEQLENLHNLPSMPEVAHRVLELRASPDPNIHALAQVIELDPSLAAQVIRYARSSLYGYRGKVDSAEAAIARVLGYDLVMNLALGLATAKPFKISRDGQLGSHAFWSRAVHNAVLSQTLSHCLPKGAGNIAGIAYLAGLLHEFGLLVMGHLYPDVYARLNNEITDNPDRDLLSLEEQLFGMTHCEVGARVLRHWALPDEIVVANLKHCDIDYDGPHHTVSQLVLLSAAMLNADPEQQNSGLVLPEQTLDRLELQKNEVLMISSQVLANLSDMDALISKLAA
jgi:HD-like signal output (HDOD) protein